MHSRKSCEETESGKTVYVFFTLSIITPILPLCTTVTGNNQNNTKWCYANIKIITPYGANVNTVWCENAIIYLINKKKKVKNVENYQRIKDLREDADKTQQDIADIFGMYLTTYRRYENGEREPPFNFILRLAKFYNVSADYIGGLTNDKRKYW